MSNILRNSLAVVAGVVLGFAVNMSIITFGPEIIPVPEGVDPGDLESLRQNIHLFEPRHFAVPFLAHASGTLVGVLTAFLIAKTQRVTLAYALGVFFLAGGVVASTMIPAPAWFIALDLLVAYLPMVWLAIRIGRGLKPGAAVSTPTRGS